MEFQPDGLVVCTTLTKGYAGTNWAREGGLVVGMIYRIRGGLVGDSVLLETPNRGWLYVRHTHFLPLDENAGWREGQVVDPAILQALLRRKERRSGRPQTQLPYLDEIPPAARPQMTWVDVPAGGLWNATRAGAISMGVAEVGGRLDDFLGRPKAMKADTKTLPAGYGKEYS